MKCKGNEVRSCARSGMIILGVLAILSSTTVIADITRTWRVHASSTDNVTALTASANTRLQTKDQGDDLAVCVTIAKGDTNGGWHFDGDAGDDGKVESSAEVTAFKAEAAKAGRNSFRLVLWTDGGNTDGIYFPTSGIMAIMDVGDGGTLAHEVGHYAGLGESTEGKTHRIMYQVASDARKTVNATEKASYEAKN